MGSVDRAGTEFKHFGLGDVFEDVVFELWDASDGLLVDVGP